jgi:hypothetical protein
VKRFDPNGDLWETDPDSCCHIRKTEPLEPITEQYGGWVTGRKRYQTKERGVLPHFELTSDDRIKVNPLAYFSDADVIEYKPEAQLARASALCQRATSRSAVRPAPRWLPKARIRVPDGGAASTRRSAASISISTEQSPTR